MGLNLRAERMTPISALITLFKERAANVAKKTETEKTITEENGKLTQQLQALFKPIALKSGIGFHVRIKDNEVEISTNANIIRRNRKAIPLNFRVGITTIPIDVWMASSSELSNYIINIEKNIRLLSMSSRKEKLSGKLSFTSSNTVTVSIETRNRYF